jgi:starvation-inducible DNA-binding protein
MRRLGRELMEALGGKYESYGNRLALMMPLWTNAMLAARDAHWNVHGPEFVGLHALFGEVYEYASEGQDRLAERAVAMGAVVTGMETEGGGFSAEKLTGLEYAKELSAKLKGLAERMRHELEEVDPLDKVSGNIMQDLTEGLERLIWKLDAHE